MKYSIVTTILVCAMSAQTFNARITGSVKDATEASVPGAIVMVTQEGTNSRKSAKTDSSGVYSIPLLMPGEYDVSIEAQGFQPQVKKGIRLEVNQTATVDFSVNVAQVQSTLEAGSTFTIRLPRSRAAEDGGA